jgi:hypothetical protein
MSRAFLRHEKKAQTDGHDVDERRQAE